jgi:hypothetical protein
MAHRPHGGRRHERVDPRELQLVYEQCTQQEQLVVDNLFKGKWGVRCSDQARPSFRPDAAHVCTGPIAAVAQVNNLDIAPDALSKHIGGLFTADVWQDDDLIKTKNELNASKNKMDDIPLQCATRSLTLPQQP